MLKAVMAAGALLAAPQAVIAHGNVTPQVIDVSELKPIGDAWVKTNPQPKGWLVTTTAYCSSSQWNRRALASP
jgi:hypothetical protein